jgi:TonB family protein
MEFLSLEQPEPRGRREMTRLEAQVASLALHLLVALLLLYVPQRLPESIRAFFGSRPPQPRTPTSVAAASQPEPAPRKPEPEIPLQFSYVDPSVRVPNDTPVRENPKARVLSDRNRIARQEVPTPREARRFSPDPHSEGDTFHRMRPDPSRPEGPESARREEPPPVETFPSRGDGAPGQGDQAEGGSGGAGPAPGSESVEGSGAAARRPRTGPGGGLPPAGHGGAAGRPIDPRERVREMLRDVQSGEFKDTFHNPSFLRDGAVGTLSFDTKDFPWGDYERQVYVKIMNSWRERLPLAYREGLRGYLCVRYITQRDGTITAIDVVRPSAVRPFNQAVLDALRAASPLPPLPEGFPRDSEGVSACFFYNMWPQEAD